MKRLYLLIFLLSVLFLLISRKSYSFDLIGLQPTAPNGVFSTFSADSLTKNKSSFEIYAERSGEPNFFRFAFKGAYGITDSIELNFTVPYVSDYMDSFEGFEDISVGIKHRFYNEGKYGPSLAYLVVGALSNGEEEFTSNGSYGAGLILSKRVGPVNGHLNLFYEKPGTDSLNDEIIFTGGIEFSAANNFKIMGEILSKKNFFTDEYDLIEARFGYRIRTTEYIYTTIGAGFDLKNRKPEYRVMFSVSFITPHEKKKIKKIYEEE